MFLLRRAAYHSRLSLRPLHFFHGARSGDALRHPSQHKTAVQVNVAIMRVLIDQRQNPQQPSLVRASADQVVAPDMIRPLRPQSNAGSIVPPQPPPGPLFLRHFQPFALPDLFDTVSAYSPSRHLQQRRDLLVPLAAILAGQGDHRCGQLILIGSLDRFVSLRSSPWPQQPAGVPFDHPVLALGTLHRTTSPLGA